MPLNLSSGEMRSFVDFIEGNVGEPPPPTERASGGAAFVWKAPRWRSPIVSRASFAGMLPG